MNTTKYYCKFCNLFYSAPSNLRRHEKKVHSDILDNAASSKKEFLCSECNKAFTKNYGLKRHIKKFHPEKYNTLVPQKQYNFECNECHKHFSDVKNFKAHQKKHQDNTNTNIIKTYNNCSLCEFKDFSKLKVIDHLKQIHDIEIECEKIEFSCVEDFESWKSETERDTNAYFVKQHAPSKTKKCTIAKYSCHRSGSFVKKGKGLRRLKIKGSNKIGSYCPAGIKLVIKNEKLDATFIKTHVGHDINNINELEHLFLKDVEKKEIAKKIAAKVPFSAILAETRNSVSNTQHQRLCFLTKKDLYNIQKSFSLSVKSESQPKNNALSLDLWVEELKTSDSVLFYKPKYIMCEQYKNLRIEDLILVIMSQNQSDLLQQFGTNLICISSTISHNLQGLKLHSILILDDLNEALPCALLISNRSDEFVMDIFFTCVKNQLGASIHTSIFMSDIDEYYYNAWIKVMGPIEFRLFCSWNVKHNWKSNLSKVESKDKQNNIHQEIHNLLQEKDTVVFSAILHYFVTSLKRDRETLEFGKYFEEHYASNVESWAYCYREQSDLNNVLHIEHMHDTIKNLFLNPEYENSLDETVYTIFKFVKDKHLNRTTNIKGNISKIKELRKSHKDSAKLNLKMVVPTEKGWLVESDKHKYLVEKRVASCNCNLFCSECETCNMCKHIHLVCRYQSGADNVEYAPSSPSAETESVDSINWLNARKEKLRAEVLEVLDSVSTFEELDAVEAVLSQIRPALAAVEKQETISIATTNKNT